MRVYVLITLLLLNYSVSANQKIYVIHGHGGNKTLMHYLASNIGKSGYVVENFGYPSYTEDIDSVSKRLFQKIQSESFDTVSFVTHSMGALVVRKMYQWLNDSVKFPHINKIIMIAPPNKGTPVADFYYPCGLMRFLAGVNLKYLTTENNTGVHALPVPTGEIGLILGITGRKHGYNPFLKGDNDGYILPERAILGVEKDITYVKAGHTSLTQNRKVKQLVLTFLAKGTFQP